MNRCPICTAKIADHKLMCWPHWDMVPAQQQEQVLGLWKTTLRGPNPSIRRLAMQEYKLARAAAIALVKEKVGA